ncbi:MAG: PAS domain-containing protein [Pyrinomonadaceae bacterium]
MGPEYAVEFRLQHKDGTYSWIYTRGLVVREAVGKPIRMLGGPLDTNARKSLEKQYRHAVRMEATDGL